MLTGASVALAPHRDFIQQSADIIKPYEMSSVPILLNKIYAGVTAKVAEGSLLRQWVVKKAFEIARRRNDMLERGLPVDSLLEWKFQKVDKIVMSKIRSKILGGNLQFLTAGGGKTSLQVLQFFEDVGVPLCEGKHRTSYWCELLFFPPTYPATATTCSVYVDVKLSVILFS